MIMNIKNNGWKKILLCALLLAGWHMSVLSVSINGQSNSDFAQEYLACVPANATSATASVSTKDSGTQSLTTELAAMCVSGLIGMAMFRLPYVKDLYHKRILNTPVTQGKIAQIIVDSVAQVALRKDLNKEQSMKMIIKDSAYYIYNKVFEDTMNFIVSDKLVKEFLVSSKVCCSLESAEIEIKDKPLLKYAAFALNTCGYLRSGYVVFGKRNLKSLGNQSNNEVHESTQDCSEETPDRGEMSEENRIGEPSCQRDQSTQNPE